MNAMKVASDAASKAFDEYLGTNTAASSVPQCVVEAAEKAYREAGGTGQIAVGGRGNTTHPVCSVYTYAPKRRPTNRASGPQPLT